MSAAKDLEIIASPPEDVIFPPGDLESDEPPLESDLHLWQIFLLLQCLEWHWRDRNDFYAAGNLTIDANLKTFADLTFLQFWELNANIAKVG